ncbi:MAG: PKD domain-containing protein [Bacteroidota bacterium]
MKHSIFVSSLLISILVSGLSSAQDATNTGTLYVTPGTDFFFGGNFTNMASAVTENNGLIQIDGNWINNGVYMDTSGAVILSGADQDITGTASTTFNNLTLQGTGIKTITLYSTVSGVLSLNNRELATGANTLFVVNADTGAVTRTSGFVSSLGNGCLSRKTNSTYNYLFPAGSSLGTQRYRPVVITPNSSSAHTFTVRLANADATTDGFDRSLKDSSLSLVNPDYFHMINRTLGTSPADVSIYFDDVLDSAFRAIAHWQTLPMWENTGTVTTVNSISPALSFITKAAWDDFSYDPFALAIIPDVVTLTVSNSTVCDGDPVVFNVTSGYTNYAFYVNALLVQSGSGNIFTSLSLNNGDTVFVEAIDGLGDTSVSNQVVITVNPVYNTSASVTICSNDSILLGGAYQDTAGVYYDTFASVAGCDSMVTTTLSIDQVYLTPLSVLICTGDSIFIGGAFQNTSGTYYDTIPAANLCDSVIATTLTVNPAITTSVSGIDASCNGVDDGSATVNAGGGIPPYTFLWSDGQTSSTATALGSGNYTITVTDSSGCTATDGTNISTSNNMTAIITGVTNASCLSVCDGIASAFATGGTTPYSYLWDDPAAQTSSIANDLCVGINNVIVTDAVGCSDTAIATVGSSPEIELAVSINPSTCGNADGSATLSITNGTAPYTYYWSSGDTLPTADSLSSGIYISTVIDDNGCSAFTIATVSDMNGPAINVLTTTDITCNGGSDGLIGISVTGGTPPYIYQWSNGSSSNFIYNLVAGPHELTVTDSTGCVANTSITLTEPDALILTVTTTDANCSNADGDATVSVSGGTGAYTYLWSDGSTNATATGIAAGIYTITVTDANGCSGSANAAVSNFGGATITIDSIIGGGCGVELGSIYINVSGGATPYTYLWSNGSTDEDLVDVSSGSYSVSITDTNGCIATANALIWGIPATEQEICLVTVDSATGRNIIVWEKLQVQGVQSYNIYKESTQAGLYYLIGNVPVDSLSQFIDSLSNPLQQAWRYKISIMDSCGNESELSQAHKTMHLTINLGIGDNINLIWDHYQGFSFLTYYIHRYSTANGWEEIDSIASNLTSRTDFSPPAGNLFYQVVVKHPDGCEATIKTKDYNSSKSNTSSISTAAAPAPDFVADYTSILVNDAVNFTDLSMNDPTSWLWTFTGGNPSNSTDQNPINIIYNDTGCYEVTLVAANIIGSDSLTKTCYINVIQTGLAPAANFTANSTSIVVGGSVNFTDISTNSPSSWSWTFQGGSPSSSTVQNPANITYSTAGFYDVKLVATNAFGSDSLTETNYIEVSPVGIGELQVTSYSLQVYPNPNRGIFNLDIYLEEKEDVKVEIFDMRGQVICSGQTGRISGLFTKEIDLSDYRGGIYHLQVVTKKGVINKKIVIE